jgi:hypothetical protein
VNCEQIPASPIRKHYKQSIPLSIMVKKIVEEAGLNVKATPKKTKIASGKSNSTDEVQKLLVENFAGLQKAMTNLSIKFGALSDNISNLLKVFEESAKNYAQSGGKTEGNKEMVKKLDSLIDQNKTIAKGLILMEGHLKEKIEHSRQPIIQSPTPTSQQRPRPLPRL